MKLFFYLTLPFLLLACGSLDDDDQDQEDPPNATGPEEMETTPEEPVEEKEDELDFIAPDTTGNLLREEDKKTVSGPAPVVVPEPAPDSAIEVKPSVPEEE